MQPNQMPRQPNKTDDGSQKRILFYVAGLVIGIGYLIFSGSGPAPDPAAAPVATSTPAPAATEPTALPAAANAAPAASIPSTPAVTASVTGAAPAPATEPAAPQVKRLEPSTVTEAELAAIPADKLPLYRDYCNSVAIRKAEEFNADPKIFIQLNSNYINSCILNQAQSSR